MKCGYCVLSEKDKIKKYESVNLKYVREVCCPDCMKVIIEKSKILKKYFTDLVKESKKEESEEISEYVLLSKI